MRRRRDETDYKELATKRGIEWIGDVIPESTALPTKWRCTNDHEWLARYSNIRTGGGCPKCRKRRKKLDDYKELADAHGVEFASDAVPNVMTRTMWCLPDGVKFSDSYNNLLSLRKRGKRLVDQKRLVKRRVERMISGQGEAVYRVPRRSK